MDIVKSVSSGYIITADISSLKSIVCDEVWQITRSSKCISGAKWEPALAPSPDLYGRFINEWKDMPDKEWWNAYKDQFQKELQMEEKREALESLRSLVESGNVVALVCFCRDGRYCHRTLVGDSLKQRYGIRVEERARERAINDASKQLPLVSFLNNTGGQ